MFRQSKGITLIELMVVVVIVGIMAAIAVPSYRNYVMRTQRTDATAALLRVAAAQEKFYLQHNTYATNAQLAAAPPDGLGIGATENGLYTLQIANGADATGFVAIATAPADSPQFADDACRSFSIDETGTRAATNASGTTNATITQRCWR